ncbi:hypothetical protein CLI75_04505 [Porphyromonas gingivalis]|nr:hypothetical protein CS546_09415 [Porphyromonas gingivalis]ATR96479.1 hypothetical protein CS548_04890 [Porphyromonas gingivalis]ATS03207.1 hypothetical protein CS059_09685 [Porphyromonas gingivalis]ATS05188.1 hypothetical protein CS374_09570 [Porphyromonas gingivalis]ATS07389.1 hypothetical protein CS387_10760 [Porphyromonas gingivalis]
MYVFGRYLVSSFIGYRGSPPLSSSFCTHINFFCASFYTSAARVFRKRWRKIFFVLARKNFTSRAKSKIFPRHVFRVMNKEIFRT